MAITNSYLTSTKNLESIINSVINAKAPERFTNKFLEDLGYKSSNDRLVIGMFKALGLLDDNGQPLQRYYEFLDQTQTGRIIALGIEEAYEDLFNLRKDAQNLSNDEVKNKLKTITQGQKSDKILGLMAMTFRAFCDLADWDAVITEEPKNVADSNKTVFVFSLTSELRPPITPAIATGFTPSQITRLDESNVYSFSFKAVIFSPSLARLTLIAFPSKKLQSNACIG